LPSPHDRLSKLQRRQFGGGAILLKLARPVVRATASFQPDPARRKDEKVQKMPSLERASIVSAISSAPLIHTMCLHNILCQIDTNCRN
jgi:hypothetical protein